MKYKTFDLNIETILEDWQPYHAVREIIANALDEMQLSKTQEISIFKDDNGRWHIKDYGRGVKYTHLTQNENPEKINNDNIIGKFGIGLKDALATFERNGIKVKIISKYGNIEIAKDTKHGFDDIETLHAVVYDTEKYDFIGTDVIIDGITDKSIEIAKLLFLYFDDIKKLDSTEFGDIYLNKGDTGKIYINGVNVSEEENFLFSYNITSLNSKIKRALNRERSNVGRAAYSERIKSILLSSRESNVIKYITDNLSKYDSGEHHDELNWVDVQEHAIKLMNESQHHVFITSDEAIDDNDIVDDMRQSGQKIIFIPRRLRDKIRDTRDNSGNPIRDYTEYKREYSRSFEYKYISINQLDKKEKRIFEKKDEIIKLFDGLPNTVNKIFISEDIRPTMQENSPVGVYESSSQNIIIKRSQLRRLEYFAGTLLHELIHARTGYADVTRDFEIELTKLLGKICSLKL